MKLYQTRWAVIVFFLLALTAIPAAAEVPLTINYQGFLTGADGQPVDDGDYAMTFAIYATAGEVAPLWSEAQTVAVASGVYNVVLGRPGNEIDPADLDGERYLGVRVGADGEMTPRQPISSTAFAIRAAVAEDAGTLDGMDAADFASSSHDHSFSELTGTATDTQIPNTITVNYAASAGNADTLDGLHATAFAVAVHNHNATEITSGTLGTARYSAVSDLGAEGYLGNAAGDIAQNNGTLQAALNADLLDGQHASAFAATAHNHNATEITSGTLDTGRFSALSDLSAEGYLDNAFMDIARNNSVLQAYLNADQLDGQHASAFIDTSSTAQTKMGEFIVDASAIYFSTGIWATGQWRGGFFQCTGDSGYAYVGFPGSGVWAAGSNQGGVFRDENDSGSASVACGDRGIWAKGTLTGGTFSHPDNTTFWADVSTPTRKIQGTGTVSFVQNHPYDENTVIVYAAPEGDEVAVYTRGSARLKDGEARVVLGETFQYVANPDIGLTAHVTPRSDNSMLYVTLVSTSELVVRSVAGFSDDAAFDYIVYGLRLGFEEVAVLQPKQKDALLPTAAAIEAGYGDRPDLRAFNAMARHREMRAAISSGTEIDLSRTRELLAALEEQRAGAMERAAARQEGVHENQEQTGDASAPPSSAGPADASVAEAGDVNRLSVRALIAELRAEIHSLKNEMAAMKARHQ